MNSFRKNLLTITTLGLLLGGLTSFGQTYLPGDFSQFANSYSVWLLASFAVGLFVLNKKQALILGALVPVLALIAYYITSQLRFESGVGSSGILLFWFAGGVTAGPILAWIALLWKQRTKWSLYAPITVSSLFISEGLYNLINLGYTVGFAFFAIALILFIVFYRKSLPIIKTFVFTAILSALLYGLYAVLLSQLSNGLAVGF